MSDADLFVEKVPPCPQLPLMKGLGFGSAGTRLDGTLHSGFNSDPDIVPDADVFVEKVQAAYEAVATEAGVERKKPLAVMPAANRQRAKLAT